LAIEVVEAGFMDTGSQFTAVALKFEENYSGFSFLRGFLSKDRESDSPLIGPCRRVESSAAVTQCRSVRLTLFDV
jgi:hypothetical protein